MRYRNALFALRHSLFATLFRHSQRSEEPAFGGIYTNAWLESKTHPITYPERVIAQGAMNALGSADENRSLRPNGVVMTNEACYDSFHPVLNLKESFS